MDAAMFAREYYWFNNRGVDIHAEQLSVMDRETFLNFLNTRDYLLTVQSLYELTGFHTSDMMECIIKHDLVPVHHQSMSDKNNLFSTATYYHSKQLLPLVEYMYNRKDFEEVSICHTHSKEDSKRMKKGIDIRHPEGEDGFNRSFKLYEKQCIDALSVAPIEVKLTYDNLDYEKIDLRKIYTTKHFKDFLKLCNCFDKDPLINFMTGDGSEASLKSQCKIVAKLPSIQNNYIVSNQTQHPSKPKTVAERKEAYELFYTEFIRDDGQIDAFNINPEFAGKSLLDTLDHANRFTIRMQETLAKEDIPEWYIDGWVEKSKDLPTSKNREDFIISKGLIASDIKDVASKKLYSEEFFDADNLERVIPTLSIYDKFKSLKSMMEFYKLLPGLLPRKEHIDKLMFELVEIGESDRYNGLYIPLSDVAAIIKIDQNDKFYYKKESLSFNEMLSRHFNTPLDKFTSVGLSSPSVIVGAIKGINELLEDSNAYKESLKKSEKLATQQKAAKNNLAKIQAKPYQDYLQVIRDTTGTEEEYDWVANYDPRKRVKAEIDRVGCMIDDANDEKDVELEKTLKDLRRLLQSFDQRMSKFNAIQPTNDDEYNELLLNHDE